MNKTNSSNFIDGTVDAYELLNKLTNPCYDGTPANAVSDALTEIVALGIGNELTAAHDRLQGFASIIGPVLVGKGVEQ